MLLRHVSLVVFALQFNTPIGLCLPAPNKSVALSEPRSFKCLSHLRCPRQTPLQPRMFNWYPFHADDFRYFEPHINYPLVGGMVVVSATLTVLIVRLLSNILDTLLNIWARSPPANLVVIEAGALRFEFGCAAQPVPWEWIGEMVESEREAVKRGFAPVFGREWWYDNKPQRRLCYAGFRVVPKGAQVIAPEEHTVGAWRPRGSVTSQTTSSIQSGVA